MGSEIRSRKIATQGHNERAAGPRALGIYIGNSALECHEGVSPPCQQQARETWLPCCTYPLDTFIHLRGTLFPLDGGV